MLFSLFGNKLSVEQTTFFKKTKIQQQQMKFKRIEEPLRSKIATYAPISGFLSVSILLLSIIWVLSTYQSEQASYSIFNHFISELGHTIDSPFYLVFSIGLCLSSILFVFLLLGLSFHIDSLWARRAMRIGILSCIACFFVGVFPGNTWKYAHLAVALTFFTGSLIAVAMFGFAIYTDPKNTMSNWYIIPSLVMVVNSAIFLLLPSASVKEFLADRAAFQRPDLWLNPFFEWMVFFSMMLWMFFISRHLYFYNKRAGITLLGNES